MAANQSHVAPTETALNPPPIINRKPSLHSVRDGNEGCFNNHKFMKAKKYTSAGGGLKPLEQYSENHVRKIDGGVGERIAKAIQNEGVWPSPTIGCAKQHQLATPSAQEG